MPTTDLAFLDRLRAATELLESVVSDRGLLAQIPPDDQRRLLQAAGHVYAPDALARRRLVRASIRRRKAEKTLREERVLGQTGIRSLRRQTVFTSPNVFPPPAFEQREVENDPEFRETARAAALLRLQAEVRRRSTISTTSSVRRARGSTSPSAPSWRISGAGWRCSPVGG